MDIEVADILPYLQSQLGALMVENAALRVQIARLEAQAAAPSPTGTEDED